MKKVLLLLFMLLAANSVNAETLKVYGDPIDGTILGPKSDSWSDARVASVGVQADTAGTGIDSHVHLYNGYQIVRSFYFFDTSSIPENAVITDVKFGANVNVVHNDDNNSYAYMGVYQTSKNPETALTVEDFDLCGDSLSSNKVDIDVAVPGQFVEFDLNASGRGLINKNGYTGFCLREGHDAENIAIANNQTFTYSGLRLKSADTAGTSLDPYLEITYTVPEENNYPLYTQIISEYPSVAETTSWANDLYAEGRGALGSYPCGLYVKNCGCALTSLVMAARNTGINNSIVNNDVNPGNLNEYLNSVGGYDSEGGLYWLKAQAYLGTLTSEGRVASRFYKTTQVSSGVMPTIDTALASGNKAVLAFKGGHFVWLPAKDGSEYIVRDPFWYETKTANDTAVPLLVRDYNNQFDSARIVDIAASPVVLSGIETHLISKTGEMLFKNAAGQKVGYENGSVLLDLANASYGNTEVVSVDGAPASGNKNLLVYDAGNQFTIDVVGTGFGTFSLQFLAITESGQTKSFTLTGSTIPGVTTTFEFNLTTGTVVEKPITYAQFLDILNKEMAGYTAQQKAFFLKWAEKIYENMETKTVSQTIQSLDVYKKLLVAKKIESPVLFAVTDVLKSQVK